MESGPDESLKEEGGVAGALGADTSTLGWEEVLERRGEPPDPIGRVTNAPCAHLGINASFFSPVFLVWTSSASSPFLAYSVFYSKS